MEKIAIIFAAGQSKRFNVDLTNNQHKSLLLLEGKSLIEHIIDFLLEVKGLTKIIVVVGHQAYSFQFLVNKYSQVVLVFNSCFKEHKTGCALLKVKNYLLKSHLAYLIAGDMVCYDNYFTNLTNINAMAAVFTPLPLNQNGLFYKISKKKEIVGFQTNWQQSSYSFGEFSVLKHDWIQAIFNNFLLHQTHCSEKEIYEILINSALKSKIKLKMHILPHQTFYDVDYYCDWQKLQKIFKSKKITK